MSNVFAGAFPPFDVGFSEKEDAGYYSVSYEDNTVRSNMEGGYDTSRPRFTRKMRKTFITGFSDITQADFEIIEEFWLQFGGHRVFTWTDPTNQIDYSARFTRQPNITYTGIGPHRSYNVEVELKEV